MYIRQASRRVGSQDLRISGRSVGSRPKFEVVSLSWEEHAHVQGSRISHKRREKAECGGRRAEEERRKKEREGST